MSVPEMIPDYSLDLTTCKHKNVKKKDLESNWDSLLKGKENRIMIQSSFMF